MDVSRGFHFHEKSRFAGGFGERRPTRPRARQSRSNSSKDRRASQDSIAVPLPLPLPSLSLSISLFPILFRDSVLSGGRDARVHQRRSETGNRPDVSAATRRNSRRVERNSLRNPPPRVYVSGSGGNIAWQQIRICIASAVSAHPLRCGTRADILFSVLMGSGVAT